SSRRRHTRFSRDWSSDVCSSDLETGGDDPRYLARYEYAARHARWRGSVPVQPGRRNLRHAGSLPARQCEPGRWLPGRRHHRVPAAPGRVRHPQRQTAVPACHHRPEVLRGQGGRRGDHAAVRAGMSADAIVVVGAGQAGGWAARTLRECGYGGRVILLGAEAHAPYERPPLSKAVLAGAAAPESAALWPADEWSRLDIEFRAGLAATELRIAEQAVIAADGQLFAYDALLPCSGGRARVPAVPGTDLPGVHVLRPRDDALRPRPALAGGERPAVVGGGWIGLQVATTARQMGCGVSVIEQADRLCARSVPPGVSAYLADLHRANGVDLAMGAGLLRIQADGQALELVQADERRVPAD